MPVCANRVCQQSRVRQMWAWSGQMYSFSSEGGRLSGVDWREQLPHIPPVWWVKAEVERDMFGIEWGGWGKGLSEADVTPLSSPCLNKSCSRSFYLHMLTGTSELPGERCREKKMKKKKTEEEIQWDWERAVPIMAAKGLNGLFSSHGVILIKPFSSNSLFLTHICREIEKVQEGDEIDLRKRLTRDVCVVL